MTRRSQRPFWLGEDARTWDHVRIHVQLFRDPRLGANELAVYGGIALHAELRSGTAHPSVATLAAYCNLSDRTIQRALRRLKDCEYLEVEERKGKASIYRLLPPPTPDTDAGVTPDTDAEAPRQIRGGRGDTDADELEPRTRTNNHSAQAREKPNPDCPECGDKPWNCFRCERYGHREVS